MSDLLAIGGSGLRAYQSALTTISENIANAGTEGYVRRSTDLTEIASPTGGITARAGITGNGVLATGVTRAADQFRAADVRTSGADLARSAASVDWMGRIESALQGNQLGARLTSFFTSATAVAADPAASAPRTAMLGAATNVASAFSGTGRALDQLASDLQTSTTQAATSLDSLGAALARVNDGLGRARDGSSGAAQLMDQRDQLLEQMSAITDVSTSFDAAGRATVKLGGANGATFVAGTESGHVSTATNADGQMSFAITYAGTTTGFAPSGGALAGYADASLRIAGAREGLNEIATGFTSGVNAIQTQGRDLDAAAGAAMFAVGGDPTEISVSLTDPRGIAAAAVGAGPRDNSNLTALANLRGSAGFEANYTGLVSGNAAALSAQKQVSAAQSSIHDNAVAARDAVSGVSLDAEAVDLMRFQQAYQAASRVIQVARDTFQSIIAIN